MNLLLNPKRSTLKYVCIIPDLSNIALEADDCPSGTQTWPVRRHRRKPSRGNEWPELKSLPVSVTFDMRFVYL